MAKTLSAPSTTVSGQIDAGSGASTIYAWGAQIEQAAMASSYIPTTSATATRAVDRHWLSGQAIDPAAGLAFLVDYTVTAGGTATSVPICFTPAGGSFSDSWYVSQNPGTGTVSLTLLDSVHGNYPGTPGRSGTIGGVCRVAASTGAAGVALAANATGSTTNAAVPTSNGTFALVGLGGASWGGASDGATGVVLLRRIAVYARQLTQGQVANPRVTRFSLPLLSGPEVKGHHRAMLRALGAVGDALWIPETSLTQAEANARSIWGAVAAPDDEATASRDSFPGSSRSFRIIERV